MGLATMGAPLGTQKREPGKSLNFSKDYSSLMSPNYPEQLLVQSRCSINICC